MNTVPNSRIFKVSYIAPTNTRGAGVKIAETKRYNDHKTKSVRLSYCYETGDVLQQAINHLKDKGFEIVGRASDVDFYYIFVNSWGENFKELI